MSKKMLINMIHPEEARVAIVEEGRLIELDVEIEGSEQTRGNIYKGSVVRVEPGLQAAFIDIGLKKLGFLQMGELHPDYWQWRDDVPEEQRKRRPRIQEVLRRGQELLVQVEKGERDMKGAALTTYLSMPGRYLVLMPGSDSAGVSRKVESESERKKLKEMAAELEIPAGIGYIIRTEALGKKKSEISKDFQSLLKLHKEIVAKGAKTKAPALIYQESDLVIRTIRDYFTAEIDEVLVDSPEVFKLAKAFFKRTMPKYESLVKLHQEKRPIFSKYQLEEQIDQIYEKKVLLKSGGSLVIEPTEALVSIDVNSGKTTGEKGVEDTAFKTNAEAAEEVARQLRLRDLGGLIVIDFIDMRDKKHMTEVEKILKNALKADKARVTVGRISQFGMLEMSRQRIKQTLDQGSVLECPHCSGRGKVKSVENMALSFLRKVHGAAAKGTVAEVRGELPLEVTYYLLNRKKQELARIERDYDIEVTVKGKPSFLMNQLEIEHLKREKLPHAEHAEQVAESIPPFDALPTDLPDEKKAPAAALPGEEKGRKKRQRGKKVREEAGSPEPEVPQVLAPVTEPESDVPEQLPEEEAHAEGAKKKKRRRRRRKGSGEAGESVAETTSFNLSVSPVAVAESVDAVPVEEKTEGAEAGEGAKKKKRRRRRRGKGQGGEVSQDVSAAAEVPAAGPADVKSVEQMADDTAQGEPHPQEATPARPKRGGRKKGPAAEAGTQTLKDAPLPDPGPSATEVPPAAAGAESVPTPLRPRKPKKSVAPVPSPDVAAEPIPEAAEQKVRPPAKKRVKKSEPLEQTASGDTPAVVAAEEQPPAPKKVRVARKRPEK